MDYYYYYYYNVNIREKQHFNPFRKTSHKGRNMKHVDNKSQVVKLNGYVSDFSPVSSGMPQQSHLGPSLFLICIHK